VATHGWPYGQHWHEFWRPPPIVKRRSAPGFRSGVMGKKYMTNTDRAFDAHGGRWGDNSGAAGGDRRCRGGNVVPEKGEFSTMATRDHMREAFSHGEWAIRHKKANGVPTARRRWPQKRAPTTQLRRLVTLEAAWAAASPLGAAFPKFHQNNRRTGLLLHKVNGYAEKGS